MSDENAAGTSKESAEPTGGAQSSAQRSGPDQAAQEAGGATPARAGEPEQTPGALGSDTSPEGGTRQAATRTRHGMFGVAGTGDTSGFGGLELPGYVPAPARSSTPSTTCCRSPTAAGGYASRSPAPTTTATSRRSSPSTRPTTGTSERRGTCSASSSTATPP